MHAMMAQANKHTKIATPVKLQRRRVLKVMSVARLKDPDRSK